MANSQINVLTEEVIYKVGVGINGRYSSLNSGFRACCPKDAIVKTAASPLLIEEGWTRPQKISPKASFDRSGRGGQKWTDHPVCASKVASQLFLIAQPPLLYEEGTSSMPSRLHSFWATRAL